MIAHITWFAQLPAHISHWVKVSLNGTSNQPPGVEEKIEDEGRNLVGDFSSGGKGEKERRRRKKRKRKRKKRRERRRNRRRKEDRANKLADKEVLRGATLPLMFHQDF